MQFITVWQPWATLIAIGAKPYEFRSWKFPSNKVGKRIGIHAAVRKVHMGEVFDLWNSLVRPGRLTTCLHVDKAIQYLDDLQRAMGRTGDPAKVDHLAPRSCLICTVELGEPKRGDECAKEFGIDTGGNDRDQHFNWGWPMLDVRRIAPVPFKGKQGFFPVGNHLIKEIENA